MELDKVPIEVCVDIGVDGTVNLFALLDQAAQRFPDRGAVDPDELDAHLVQRLRALQAPPSGTWLWTSYRRTATARC